MPVAYRVRTDLTTLASKPPLITVRVEATPGSDVRVDDKPLTLDPQSKGSYAIELGQETEGLSRRVENVRTQDPFAITPKGAAAPESGQLIARTAIVPLHLDAPGLMLITDRGTAAVSARRVRTPRSRSTGSPFRSTPRAASASASSSRAGREVARASSPSSPPLAPRIVHAKVVRTNSLEASAKEARQQGRDRFDAIRSRSRRGRSVRRPSSRARSSTSA